MKVWNMPENEDRAKEMLAAMMGQAGERLSAFLDANGVSVPVLARAAEQFAESLPDLPGDSACRAGCAWCCHLRIGVSIPEVLVIFETLKARATPEAFEFFRKRVLETSARGNVLDEDFWLAGNCPCPFLDTKGGQCLIYDIRPFSCRAFHSTDEAVCRAGFEEKKQVDVPCFPLYRSMVDGYAAVLIRTLAQKGLPSFQVGFVMALAVLFREEGAVEAWLRGEDLFASAKI